MLPIWFALYRKVHSLWTLEAAEHDMLQPAYKHLKQTLHIHLSESIPTQCQQDTFDRYIRHKVFSTARSKSVPSTLHFTEHWQSCAVLEKTSLVRAALGTWRKLMWKCGNQHLSNKEGVQNITQQSRTACAKQILARSCLQNEALTAQDHSF